MDKQLHYGDDYHLIPAISTASGHTYEVVPDISCHTIQIVNIAFVGKPDTSNFVLVDAGMPGSAQEIITFAENRFGSGCRPQAIVLTHGHFDHVGAILELVEHWSVPVYAHEREIPYLTGASKYPDPDPSVEGGMIAKLSAIFPNEPINLGSHVQTLPTDGTIPHLADFRWIHTPGHTPGHISLFRELDRTLIVGDAFVTVRQDSLHKVLIQQPEISGPPRYLTTDWKSAYQSVKACADLRPAVAITGHGMPVRGNWLENQLDQLVRKFDQIAVPDYGKYVH